MGVKGRMWRVIKKVCDSSKSAVLLEGEKSNTFDVAHSSLRSTLTSTFPDALYKYMY